MNKGEVYSVYKSDCLMDENFLKMTLRRKERREWIYLQLLVTLILKGSLELSLLPTPLISLYPQVEESLRLWIRDEIDSKDQPGHLANVKVPKGDIKGKPVDIYWAKALLSLLGCLSLVPIFSWP